MFSARGREMGGNGLLANCPLNPSRVICLSYAMTVSKMRQEIWGENNFFLESIERQRKREFRSTLEFDFEEREIITLNPTTGARLE